MAKLLRDLILSIEKAKDIEDTDLVRIARCDSLIRAMISETKEDSAMKEKFTFSLKILYKVVIEGIDSKDSEVAALSTKILCQFMLHPIYIEFQFSMGTAVERLCSKLKSSDDTSAIITCLHCFAEGKSLWGEEKLLLSQGREIAVSIAKAASKWCIIPSSNKNKAHYQCNSAESHALAVVKAIEMVLIHVYDECIKLCDHWSPIALSLLVHKSESVRTVAKRILLHLPTNTYTSGVINLKAFRFLKDNMGKLARMYDGSLNVDAIDTFCWLIVLLGPSLKTPTKLSTEEFFIFAKKKKSTKIDILNLFVKLITKGLHAQSIQHQSNEEKTKKLMEAWTCLLFYFEGDLKSMMKKSYISVFVSPLSVVLAKSSNCSIESKEKALQVWICLIHYYREAVIQEFPFKTIVEKFVDTFILYVKSVPLFDKFLSCLSYFLDGKTLDALVEFSQTDQRYKWLFGRRNKGKYHDVKFSSGQLFFFYNSFTQMLKLDKALIHRPAFQVAWTKFLNSIRESNFKHSELRNSAIAKLWLLVVRHGLSEKTNGGADIMEFILDKWKQIMLLTVESLKEIDVSLALSCVTRLVAVCEYVCILTCKESKEGIEINLLWKCLSLLGPFVKIVLLASENEAKISPSSTNDLSEKSHELIEIWTRVTISSLLRKKVIAKLNFENFQSNCKETWEFLWDIFLNVVVASEDDQENAFKTILPTRSNQMNVFTESLYKIFHEDYSDSTKITMDTWNLLAWCAYFLYKALQAEIGKLTMENNPKHLFANKLSVEDSSARKQFTSLQLMCYSCLEGIQTVTGGKLSVEYDFLRSLIKLIETITTSSQAWMWFLTVGPSCVSYFSQKSSPTTRSKDKKDQRSPTEMRLSRLWNETLKMATSKLTDVKIMCKENLQMVTIKDSLTVAAMLRMAIMSGNRTLTLPTVKFWNGTFAKKIAQTSFNSTDSVLAEVVVKLKRTQTNLPGSTDTERFLSLIRNIRQSLGVKRVPSPASLRPPKSTMAALIAEKREKRGKREKRAHVSKNLYASYESLNSTTSSNVTPVSTLSTPTTDGGSTMKTSPRTRLTQSSIKLTGSPSKSGKTSTQMEHKGDNNETPKAKAKSPFDADPSFRKRKRGDVPFVLAQESPSSSNQPVLSSNFRPRKREKTFTYTDLDKNSLPSVSTPSSVPVSPFKVPEQVSKEVMSDKLASLLPTQQPMQEEEVAAGSCEEKKNSLNDSSVNNSENSPFPGLIRRQESKIIPVASIGRRNIQEVLEAKQRKELELLGKKYRSELANVRVQYERNLQMERTHFIELRNRAQMDNQSLREDFKKSKEEMRATIEMLREDLKTLKEERKEERNELRSMNKELRLENNKLREQLRKILSKNSAESDGRQC